MISILMREQEMIDPVQDVYSALENGFCSGQEIPETLFITSTLVGWEIYIATESAYTEKWCRIKINQIRFLM